MDVGPGSGLSLDLPDGLREVRRRFPARSVPTACGVWRVRDTAGVGAPVVLLPGSLGNADIFFGQVLALSSRFRVVAADYPDAPAEALADGLAALLDRLGMARANLVGSSLAGYWLQFLGRRHPERVATVVLANTFCDGRWLRGHPLFSIAKLEAVTGDVLKAEWLATLEARAPDPLRDTQLDLLRERQDGEQLRWRLLSAAKATSAPTMDAALALAVIDCADDPILSQAARDEVAARYPAARRMTLPAGGHYPHVTQSDDYNRFLEDVLGG